MAIEFKRNKETGEVEAYKDGKKLGKIITMGDEFMKRPEVNKDGKRRDKVRDKG